MLWFKKGEVETDPVCLMKVNRENAKITQVYKAKTYYFCSENCKEQFKQNPEKYSS
ncbi:MAG: Heavy metal translocating P-type ATPase [Candidatus Curtissbacteria bacterium GW2011_GWC2_38_9]|uniref:Heavy metal translocating P-type ATPase n=2 Tax=Candidatus Curtissiibacteriota TaxID=1752717 RepID=A0A0G0LF44_9BACT|nr:MAG: Heavy metal translocating P-type ATPase [Candidatus Curtissbacteria bacterium GW2011_GWC2_38_9]KKS04638.1 MAG: Heavy metal translocating P-type ATPase [Candidatus Curtissbacteria bacterium GW2011_GWA2_41_24]